ncbi:MAG: hypothetical protein Q4C47_03205, partial [Planctomycetia bacterium]|nr:hypothetical protein [Planctomycetia bacterium]
DRTRVMNVYLTFAGYGVEVINQYYRTNERVAVTWALTFGYESFNSSGESVQPLDAATVSLSTVRPAGNPYPSFFDLLTFAESPLPADWLFRGPDNTVGWPKDKNEWDMTSLGYDRASLTSPLSATTFFLGTLSVTRKDDWADDGTTFMVRDQLVGSSGRHLTAIQFRVPGSSSIVRYSSYSGSLVMGILLFPNRLRGRSSRDAAWWAFSGCDGDRVSGEKTVTVRRKIPENVRRRLNKIFCG